LFDNHICRIKRLDTCRISDAPLRGRGRSMGPLGSGTVEQVEMLDKTEGREIQ